MTNRAILDRHLANIALPTEEQDHSIYAENVVSEFPYAPDGFTTRLEDLAGLAKFLAAIGGFSKDRAVENLEVGDYGSGIVGTFDSHFTLRESGKRVRIPMVMFFDVENGRVVRFREYYDPVRVLKAFGEYPE